jgi:hypothetical protein
MTDLSIIIVSYNTRADLHACLESLDRATPAVSHDIVVVDNGSSDGSVEAARRWPGVRVIEVGRNAGFASANNIGIRATASNLVLLLNSDTVVPPGAIDGLVADLRSHPEAAVAGPRLVDAHGKPEISFGRMIGPWQELRQKAIWCLYDRDIPPVPAYVRWRLRRARTVDWVTGACLLVRRDDAYAAGLLDERFFMYTEDVDFCAAVRRMGRLVRYTPAATIVHRRGRSAAHAPAATSAAYRRSQVAFYEKHHPRWAPILRAYLRLKGELPRDA